MQRVGGIRVDVDSIGDIDALPATLELLDDCGVKASFFVAMGPDKAGRNVLKYLTRPRALGRAKPMRFGLRNLMRGLISPACMEDYRSELREIKKRGHEVGLHGYDHYRWIKTGGREAGALIEKGRTLFEGVFKSTPRAFASPGFTMNKEILNEIEDFDYSSDFIHEAPFYPSLNGVQSKTLQVPVSMKSIGEFDADGLNDSRILQTFKQEIGARHFFTFYFHPSYEARYRPALVKNIIEILKDTHEVLTFAEIADRCKNENTPDL